MEQEADVAKDRLRMKQMKLFEKNYVVNNQKNLEMHVKEKLASKFIKNSVLTSLFFSSFLYIFSSHQNKIRKARKTLRSNKPKHKK